MQNCLGNRKKISRLIELADKYPDIIFSLSVGNEACVEWTDHYVAEKKVIEYVKQVKRNATQPVTFCENYVPWLYKLEKLAEVVILSLSTPTRFGNTSTLTKHLIIQRKTTIRLPANTRRNR
jgi:hypothetical protein